MTMHIITAQHLIDRLKREFPNELPSDPNVTIGDVREAQGIQKVIEYAQLLVDDNEDEE